MESSKFEIVKRELVEILKPLGPDRVILFGSHATDTAGEESDIDLFLVKKGLPKEEVREYLFQARRRLRKLVFKYRVAFDLFGDTPERMRWRIEVLNDPFYREIQEEGVVLWETGR
jgi:predicted nucleotidyltransferase